MNNSIDNHDESGEAIADAKTDDVEKDLEKNLLSRPLSPDTEILDAAPTEIQTVRASLVHVHRQVELELPSHFSVIHIGKPNDEVPPDIDISGFPNSQIVSRIHADIIRDNNKFYIEDTGSANGTYINHTPLPKGNRHLLKSGDRIAFGKEDKVSFIFELKT